MLPQLPLTEPMPCYDHTVLTSMEYFYTTNAIRQRHCLHPNMIRMLDDAVKGQAHLTHDIEPYLPNEENTGYQHHDWDGTLNEYRFIQPENILWYTLRDYYGWSLPGRDSIHAIQQCVGNRTLIEFGQGTGYVARALESHGTTMRTAECFNSRYDGVGIWRTPDSSDGYTLMNDHRHHPLLISWPDPSIDPDFLNDRASGSDLLLMGTLKYCGIDEELLTKLGYTAQKPLGNIACSSGNIGPIQHWIAP